MGIFKKIITFRPSFALRIIAGLISLTISLAVCFMVGLADTRFAMNERDLNFRARSIEQGARYFEDQCSRCHGIDGKGIEGIGPGISNENFLGQLEYGEVDGQRVMNTLKPSPRLAELGYIGTLRDYVRSVIASGLPIKSSNEWDSPHPPFHEKYGGPFREDQVDNVANFVLNWGIKPYSDAEAIIPPPPGAGGAPKPTPVPLTAEQEAGKKVYLGTAGCQTCHAIKGVGNQGVVGPNLAKIATVAGERIASDEYKSGVKGTAATTAEEYIIQSIHEPNAFVVPKCPAGACVAGVMTQNFKTSIPEADFKNLVAYMLTLK